MANYLLQKDKYLNKELVNVFHFLSIFNLHSFLVGTASLRNILYNNDYDLNENFNATDTIEILNKLYKEFLQIFEKSKKNPLYYILDFKNGFDDKDNPLRWNFEDMKKGYKVVDGKKYTFQESLLCDNNVIKIDICFLLNNQFTDITNNYIIHFVSSKKDLKKNLDMGKEEYIKRLQDDIKKFIKDKNYYKALRRYFSILRINHKVDNTLLNLFNGNYGILYKTIHDLDMVKLMLEQTFKPISIELINQNLEIIKNLCSKITEFDVVKILSDINNIINIKSKKSKISKLEKLVDYSKRYLNSMVKPNAKIIKL